jgi:hypothetical protein
VRFKPLATHRDRAFFRARTPAAGAGKKTRRAPDSVACSRRKSSAGRGGHEGPGWTQNPQGFCTYNLWLAYGSSVEHGVGASAKTGVILARKTARLGPRFWLLQADDFLPWLRRLLPRRRNVFVVAVHNTILSTPPKTSSVLPRLALVSPALRPPKHPRLRREWDAFQPTKRRAVIPVSSRVPDTARRR